MSTYIKMRLMLLVITLLASTIIIYFLYSKGNLSKVMFLLVLPTVIGLSMQSISVVYFQLKEQMKQIAKIRTLSAILSVFFVVLGMLCKFDINSIAFLYGCSYVIAGIYGLYMLFTKNSLRFSSEFDKSLLTGVPAFIISGLLIMILPQLGPLVLEKTVSLNELGNFSVAYRIPAALYQIPGVVAGAFYPVLFRYYNSKDLIKHKELNFLQVKIMGLMGICLCIPLFHLSNIIVEIVFGEEWDAAAIGLKILSLMLFLQSFNFPLADGLTTRNLQSKRTITQFLAVLLGIVLYYVFSLKFGVVGGATAAVFIEVIMLLGFIIFNPNKKN
ncbi:oligosaccharide flippase family protein [Bacillus toyonensis]